MASSPDRALVADVRRRLAVEADPDRAAGQQRYMKSALPYYGVPMPRVKAICREVYRGHRLDGYAAWRDTIILLFREAAHREEWYAALELAMNPAYREYARRLESLDLYEQIIVGSAWWDIVDAVASRLVGSLYATDGAWTAARMREWATDEHLWKRRTAILSQLRRGAEVDIRLLEDCIRPNLAHHDFFIRKAIGWALRQLAKTHPAEVTRYVEAHRDELSALSRREATKNLEPP